MRLELASGGDVMAATDTVLDALEQQHSLDRETRQTLRLVLEEVLVNVTGHGYGGEAGRPITVDLEVKGDRVCLAVEDEAPTFNPLAEAPSPDLESDLETREPGGLGVFLVRTLMDRVEYRRTDRGNRLEFEKTITV